MTSIELSKFNEVIEVDAEELPLLPLPEHGSKAKEVYEGIRPALLSFGGILSLFFPKLKKAIPVLIAVLDALFKRI